MRYDVTIVGGGLTGLVAALACAQAGMRTAIVERFPLSHTVIPAFDGRTTALAEGTVRLFRRIGVWETLHSYGEAMRDIRVVDGNSSEYVHYHHRDIGEEPFGYIVENRHIRQSLLHAVDKEERITVYDDKALVELDTTASYAEIVLSGETTLRSAVLVAADGRNSHIRERVGIQTFTSQYAQTAIVCTLKHTLPHHGVAMERFLPSGPFAVLPMCNNHVSIVWTEQTDRVPAYMALEGEAFIRELRDRIGDWLGDLELVGKRWSYPLSVMAAESLVAPRVALVGDAAHVIHPIAGQGVNLGYRDVAVLVERLAAQFQLGLDIGAADVLEAYSRDRQLDVQGLIGITDSLNRLFSTRFLPLTLARRAGLATVNRMPAVKRLFMRHAMGILGDVPELMRG